MPDAMEPRIGLITETQAQYNEWRRLMGMQDNVPWRTISLADVLIMRQRRWLLTNILCLPGWENLPTLRRFWRGQDADCAVACPSSVGGSCR